MPASAYSKILLLLPIDIASGGIDCNLVHCQVGTRKITVYPPIPPRNLISFSEDHGLLLLQYESYLELWRLGEADQVREIYNIKNQTFNNTNCTKNSTHTILEGYKKYIYTYLLF